MNILEIIAAALTKAGIDKKYAAKVKALFNIEKEDENLDNYIKLFKENILPDLQPQQPSQEAIQAAVQSAIADYEKKNGLKDGKPIEEPNPDEDPYKGLPPAIVKLIEAQNKQLEELKGLVETKSKETATAEKKATAKALVANAKLPEGWLDRVSLESETSLEDQVKALGEEYIKIQQDAINEKVASGEYSVGSFQPRDRSEADWAKLMDGDTTPNNPGTVDLGLK